MTKGSSSGEIVPIKAVNDDGDVVEVVADEGIRATSLERVSALAAGLLFGGHEHPVPPDRLVGDRRQFRRS